jgi:RHS repeat-associated protein
MYITDEAGKTSYYTFDAYQNLTEVTYPEGNKLQYTYDSRSNKVARTLVSKTPGTPASVSTTATFDAVCSNQLTCNQPSSTTDARGNTTDFTYDAAHGGVLTVTRPAPTTGAVRPQTRYQYAQYQAYVKNSAGGIVASGVPTYLSTVTSTCRVSASCAGTADEAKQTTDYGPQVSGTANNLLPVSVTTAVGDGSVISTTTATYDGNGWRLTEDGPLTGADDTVRFRYNLLGQVVGTIGPDPDGAGPLNNRAVRTTYEANGFPTLIEFGTVADQSDTAWSSFTSLQQRQTEYDTAARKTKETSTGGGVTLSVKQFTYGTTGALECTALRMNPAAFGSLPTSACTLGTLGIYGYDRISKIIYDIRGRISQQITALGSIDQTTDEARTYTDNGNLATVTDGENNLTTYTYDGLDRLAQQNYPNLTKGSLTSSTSDYEQFTHDATGSVTARRRRDGTTTYFTLDALDRVTFKDAAGTDSDVAYTYDNAGHIVSATLGASTLTYGYDALGRETTETSALGTVTSGWDVAGRRTSITHPDGFFVAQDYLVTGQISAVRENGATSGPGVLASYTYDALGRLALLTRGDGSLATFGYDGSSRMVSASDDLAGTMYDQAVTFGLNPAGQIIATTRSNDLYAWGGHFNTSRVYAQNGLNQETSVNGSTIGYDSNGNISGTSTDSFSYDHENRLTAATTTYGSATLAYDAIGRLTSKIGTSTERYLYDGVNLIAEYDASGNVIRRYASGPAVDQPLAWYEGAGTTDRRFLHADERGSIAAVSNSAGAVLAINSYDEYGVPGAGNIGKFQYTGQVWLPELGMYYYKARIYASRLGRFIQTDPLGYKDGLNIYEYAADDPINGSDPTGLLCGFRDSKGRCKVKVRNNASEAEREAQRKLQDRLNQSDPAVQNLPDSATITVTGQPDSSGEVPIVGTLTGAEFKWLWNHVGTEIVPNGTVFTNGGAGGGSSATWHNGHLVKGTVRLTPDAVSDYEQRAVTHGATAEEGQATLLFHELSHDFVLSHQYTIAAPPHPGPFGPADWTREARSSNVGHAILNSVGGKYVCAVTTCE